MSRSIDLFIDCDRPIEEVAAELTRLTGLALTPGSIPGTWSMEEGGVHADLRAHPYVADDDLPFDSYRYALSARVAQGVRTSDSAEATMLRLIGESLHRGGISALLVHDLQYRERTGWGSARPPADGGGAHDAGGSLAGRQGPGGGDVAGALDAGAPDVGKLEAGALDAGKPEAGKPEAGKLDSGKPEAGKSGARKSGAGKRGADKPAAGERA